MLAGALHTHTYMGIYPQSLESELSSCRHELEESQSKMEELERSLDDKQEAVRVVEKKSQNMVSGINTVRLGTYMYMYTCKWLCLLFGLGLSRLPLRFTECTHVFQDFTQEGANTIPGGRAKAPPGPPEINPRFGSGSRR